VGVPSAANEVNIRDATSDDVAFLWQMTYEAAFWRADKPRPTFEDAVASGVVGPYIEGWGRDGDRAVIADASGEPVGAARCRTFSPD
jgi:hypothetical protein